MKFDMNLDTLQMVLSGTSSLDVPMFMGNFSSNEEGVEFFKSYGFDPEDPVENAELFGVFQESLQFIKRYFLKSEENKDGVDFDIPPLFYSVFDISELLVISSRADEDCPLYENIWGSIILKVMHTLLHTDKDLRYHYFVTIQTQIFDRFYKHLHRDEEDNLFLGDDSQGIPLHSFETKANKTRESIALKLLHKKENVAEELFDRIGVRLVAKYKKDVLKVIKFLYDNHIVIVNNLKPSRTVNTMFDLTKFQQKDLESGDIYQTGHTKNDNNHSSGEYRAVHFTSRQLIKYQNPFLREFNIIKAKAQEAPDAPLAADILGLDTNSITQNIRFYYPFEVQITDELSHRKNTEGSASHKDYKKSQLISARDRLFAPLLK